MSDRPISVLLVEDHALLRRELKRTLNEDSDIAVVGEAANGLEAVSLAERLVPDVVVMDLIMPVMDGLEATRRIIERDPSAVILVLSIRDQKSATTDALNAGAKEFLAKSAAAMDVAHTIKRLATAWPRARAVAADSV